MFDLTDLLDHARAKQGVFIHKGNADQIVVGLLAAPGDNAGVACGLAEQGDAHFYGAAAAEAAWRIARHAAEADIVQALAWHERLPAQNQFHRHVAGVTQESTHDQPLPMPSF